MPFAFGALTLATICRESRRIGNNLCAPPATNGIGGTVSLSATLTVMPPSSQTNLVFRAKAGASGSGAIMELIWPAGTLYSAPAVTGPWTAVSGATLPYYTVSPTNAAMFFRREYAFGARDNWLMRN
jgi:hypothetical protein